MVMVALRRKFKFVMFDCGCVHWSCWLHWRGWCKPVVAAFYTVLLIVTLPLLIYHVSSRHNYTTLAAWFLAGLFVLLTLPVFLAGLVQHILNYTQPHLQKHIIRILWIVPVYSLNSFLALTVPKSAIYLDTLRECYEAYVLYNFLCYLCNFLTSEYNLVAELEARPTVSHLFPCCCIPPWPKGEVFVRRCRIGVLQYVVVRIVVTVIALITQLSHAYTKGSIKANNAWVYLSVANGISQACALHSLIYFYRGTRQLLRPLHPIGKFLSIKIIIFAMFWQTIVVSILVKTKVIPASWEEYDLQEGLLNFLVVMEMVLFAFAHYFVFSHKPYVDPAAAQVPCITTCLRMLDVRDVADDVKEHFVDPIPRPHFRIARGPGQRNSGSDGGNTSEDSPLLNKHRENMTTGNGHAAIGPEAEGTAKLERSALSELSYDVLTYKDMESRTAYGVRARMIASACRDVVVEAEDTDSGSNGSTPDEKPLATPINS